MHLLRRLALVVVPTVLVVTGTTTCPAAHLVRLTRWEEPAVLIANHGPGVEYYKLIARMEWQGAAEDGKTYNIHIIYPDGRTQTREIPAAEIAAKRVTALVLTSEVRNRRPAEVVLWVNLSDPATNAVLSNELEATIEDFPRPTPAAAANDPTPFGWGKPLSGAAGEPRRLPRPAPGGFEFVRIPASDAQPGFFIATTEATNAQLAKGQPGYDPRAGRSDEFTLEDPAQPAVGLNPKQAQDYLAALSKADPSGVTYRLPAQAEWLRAARAGKEAAFWWGDESSYPAGANFLGPEPALPTDTTAPARTVEREGVTGFAANPWGLFHTFGNVAEWANAPGAGFVRLGGHFRTEPATPLAEVAVEDAATTGPDAYVGVRPAFDLDGETGAELVRKRSGAMHCSPGSTWSTTRTARRRPSRAGSPILRCGGPPTGGSSRSGSWRPSRTRSLPPQWPPGSSPPWDPSPNRCAGSRPSAAGSTWSPSRSAGEIRSRFGGRSGMSTFTLMVTPAVRATMRTSSSRSSPTARAASTC